MSADRQKFEVGVDVAKMSVMIKDMIEGEISKLSLPAQLQAAKMFPSARSIRWR